jgi:1-acyl-sn-glycerol-3-phosphate acyltransferase
VQSKSAGLTGPISPSPIYWILRWFVRAVIGVILFRRVHIKGKENVPRQGGLLVVSNHIATADPPLEGALFPRPVHFMAKVEWFTGNPLEAFLARQFLCYPVVRHTADRASLRYTLDLLRRGQAVLVYPEGTRAVDARLHRAEAGIGFLARRSGVPVVPVAIHGSENVIPKGGHWPKRAHTWLVYGAPFTLPATITESHEAADYVMSKIAELLPVEYRGEYAGYAMPQKSAVG